ncbi:type III-B CRISPR module RAMP protein Cmr4 [Scytonema sp. PCC 10023]|uniref:type III-B CRISPR module RAMP protein Cmr4 n=1 Tax=Scytonema sp. PCC 10023 TaxID=1680591 RepID=UPI0039C6D4BA
MYQKAYGIIETLAPLHVGASAGEETGNLNLIFRDQFTQTGIIPGSSIRGRFRADMRSHNKDLANDCYGHEAKPNNPNSTTEALIKFEYASLVWLPVFCPGQPVVWVTCPRLLRRYQKITKTSSTDNLPKPYQVQLQNRRNVLFFNLGFLDKLQQVDNLSQWIPTPQSLQDLPVNLVVVDDNDIGIIHEMALYHQSRVRLKDEEKIADDKGFFNVEALPEGSILVFPVAVREQEDNSGYWQLGLEETKWEASKNTSKVWSKELYFGGLESIGFGRCQVTLTGKYFTEDN